MGTQVDLHIKPARAHSLPESLRLELRSARLSRGWSQVELGRHAGLPQTHISAIETGRTVPRFDTLLDLVRVLDRDLLLVPRALVPAIQALIRDHRAAEHGDKEEPHSLYANDEANDQRKTER